MQEHYDWTNERRWISLLGIIRNDTRLIISIFFALPRKKIEPIFQIKIDVKNKINLARVWKYQLVRIRWELKNIMNAISVNKNIIGQHTDHSGVAELLFRQNTLTMSYCKEQMPKLKTKKKKKSKTADLFVCYFVLTLLLMCNLCSVKKTADWQQIYCLVNRRRWRTRKRLTMQKVNGFFFSQKILFE